MCPEFELKSYSTAEVIFGKSKQEEVVYDIIQLMKRGSQALQDDVVITAADPETHNDPRLRSQNATVTVDLKGNRRPYVRVWGIVGEHFLYEVVELLRGAKWLNGHEWFFPQFGLFVDSDGVEHWPPCPEDAKYPTPLKTTG